MDAVGLFLNSIIFPTGMFWAEEWEDRCYCSEKRTREKIDVRLDQINDFSQNVDYSECWQVVLRAQERSETEREP